MKRLIVAGAVALMCAGGAAGAQEDVMSPAEIVAARQAALMMSGVQLKAWAVRVCEGIVPLPDCQR